MAQHQLNNNTNTLEKSMETGYKKLNWPESPDSKVITCKHYLQLIEFKTLIFDEDQVLGTKFSGHFRF